MPEVGNFWNMTLSKDGSLCVPESGTRNQPNGAVSGTINCQEMAISGAINCQNVSQCLNICSKAKWRRKQIFKEKIQK